MFNSESTLEECLRSIPKNCELVLVDQHSGDRSVSVARAIRPDAKLIKAGANRGFGAGCNLGAANAGGDVLVFLNPDASFLTPESLQIISDTARSTNTLVGPRILNQSGEDQTRARYWSSVQSELGAIFLPGKLVKGAFVRDIPHGNEVYRTGGPVPYVQGSCMAISAANFWRVDGFDERLFLYREEETLSLKLLQHGIQSFLEPRAVITHIGGRSTQQLRNFSAAQYYRSEILFYRSRYSRPVAFTATLMTWISLTTMAVLTPVRKFTGPRKDIGYPWYRAAAKGVASGWRREVVVPPRVLIRADGVPASSHDAFVQ